MHDCDGNLVRFGDILAARELVFLSVGAGWCQPCIDEAAKLELGFHRQYCDRGLGVVQILFQDDSGGPATKHFCKEWRESYGLTFPVPVDPLFVTGAFFDGSTAPLNVLVNKEGVIESTTC